MRVEIPEFDDILPTIRCLPADRTLTQAELLRAEFCIYRHRNVESYYMPFGSPVSGARLLLAGITPGWHQMELARSSHSDRRNGGAAASQPILVAK